VLEFDGLSDYLEAGPKRLADARELLQHPSLDALRADAGHRHLRGAVYLAGYAVECALKAYIISRTPPSRTFTEAVMLRAAADPAVLGLQGAATHRLGALFRATDLAPSMDADFPLRALWGVCLTWSPTWRYHPRHLTSRSRARQIVEAAAAVYAWVDAQRRE
jgi:HEPN domain-containing protein